jgi:GDP-4-dehydro-6-deoxy-D-mannose reductase
MSRQDELRREARHLRALITGIDGFVGPYLARELRAQTAWELVGLGRHLADDCGCTPVVADLLDRELVRRVVAEVAPTHVFHLAAQSHVPTSQQDGGATLQNNIAAQVNLLDACRELPAPPRILVVGSGEEYGLVRPDELPIREEQPFRPTNPYAVSKVAQDLLGWQYFHSHGLPVVRVRPFNHHGPGQSDRFVMAAFARQVAEVEVGLRPPVVRVGNLDAQRDFLDVRDVVRAYRLALTQGTPGEVYNIASGVAIRIGDALNRLLALAARPITVEFDPNRLRPSDVPVLVADAGRLRAATGWRPEISFEQSLRDTLDWWRERVGVAPVAP